MSALSTRIRRAADELEAADVPVTGQAIAKRLAPTLSAVEREALLLVGMQVAIRDALTKPVRRRRPKP